MKKVIRYKFKKIDACYNNKLDCNITLDMYKINMNNPPRNLIVNLIDGVEVTEDNNVDISYKFN